MSDLTRDSAKAPEETVAVRWRYGRELATGETISNPVVTLTKISGGAGNVTVVGAPAIDGTDVVALLTGGVAGALWRRHCKVTTSTGQVLARARLLPIEDL